MDRRNASETNSKPRIVLVTPPVDDAARFAPQLASACGKADIAAVILRLAPADDSALIERVRILRAALPDGGPILMLDGLSHLVGKSSADGVQLQGSDLVESSRKSLKQEHTIGAARLQSRHDAMVSAEGGADYVMFGEPDANGKRMSLPALLERVEWWAELFVIPCVAYAAHLDEIAKLLDAGADFIGLGEEAVWRAANGPEQALSAAMARLTIAEPAQ